jgi:bis(5'-nucleosyl)-tetraphosphatase (symmetrical)
MPTYAIGDVQGCHIQLRRLLDRLRFDPARDQLWFCGDLVNRGPQSLQTLRLVRSLGDAAVVVLGNHDLHLLAAAAGGRVRGRDTFEDVLRATDRDELLAWLRSRPLLHEAGQRVLVHAALAPQWDLDTARTLAREVEAVVSGPRAADFFAAMYGDEPARWSPDLSGWDRLRFAVNCLTRLRCCDPDGRVRLDYKGDEDGLPPGLLPWFQVPGRRSAGHEIFFGHWSALGRVHWPEDRVWCLDTGCVWGRSLSAVEVETRRLVQVRCDALA